MNSKKYEMDMCNGPLFSKLIIFAFPVVISGMLQLLFNAVDIIVVGRFTGSNALAAVGATTSLINIFTTLFIGVSLGGNVLAAGFFARGDEENMSETVHTAITMAIICGVCMIALGWVTIRPLLNLMGTPAEIIDQSSLYMHLYFIGMPFFMVYNFGSAILRAVGDTRRPLYYLAFAGICNVVLNLLLVIIFHLGVAGVAWGTVLSQFVSAMLVARCLMKSEGSYRLNMRKLHINRRILMKILKIGIPAGIQTMLINVSNALIQSSVNSFGTLAVAGNTAAVNLNGFLYMAANGITQAGLSFTSQNNGVGNYKRIKSILIDCIIMEIVLGEFLGGTIYLFGTQILGIYSKDPQVIAYGMLNVLIVCLPYSLCGIMDLVPGCIRGLGYSIVPMLISFTGVVLFRFFWIFVVFPRYRSLETIYISYPVSWILTSIAHLIGFAVVFRMVKRKNYQ